MHQNVRKIYFSLILL